ncbi:hypothetical protein [Mycobacterium sp. pW045]|uniref:hypothetical protein n=1 Tax=Mycobacterium sp. pW045 TaxID=3238984 RepID=UPI00351BA8CE
MSRTVATVWHASLSTLAAILYFLFVIPRWWELTGFSPHVLGTVLRIFLGLLVAGTALPVVATLRHARKPEYGTPQLTLTLLTGSIVGHVVAGILIAGTAISEIWLSLDTAGVWLFGIYGAAAAIALLGIGAFYLSFVAAMPPPPPKPLKPKSEKQSTLRRWRAKKAKKSAAAANDVEDGDTDEETDTDAGTDADTDADEDAGSGETVEADSAAEVTESAGEEAPELAPTGAQQKLRPSGKRRAKKSK